MLTIRKEQIKALAQLEVEKFEDWMLVHLRKFFPAQCRAAGETKLLAIIRSGIERAAGYGIKTRRDVCKYIDLMVVLGPDFDEDPRLPWVAKILLNRGPAGQRMRDLLAAVQRHLRQSKR